MIRSGLVKLLLKLGKRKMLWDSLRLRILRHVRLTAKARLKDIVHRNAEMTLVNILRAEVEAYNPSDSDSSLWTIANAATEPRQKNRLLVELVGGALIRPFLIIYVCRCLNLIISDEPDYQNRVLDMGIAQTIADSFVDMDNCVHLRRDLVRLANTFHVVPPLPSGKIQPLIDATVMCAQRQVAEDPEVLTASLYFLITRSAQGDTELAAEFLTDHVIRFVFDLGSDPGARLSVLSNAVLALRVISTNQQTDRVYRCGGSRVILAILTRDHDPAAYMWSFTALSLQTIPTASASSRKRTYSGESLIILSER
jgi:hypothetical protein